MKKATRAPAPLNRAKNPLRQVRELPQLRSPHLLPHDAEDSRKEAAVLEGEGEGGRGGAAALDLHA
eukprot:758628-Hanusia_phi.AAC.1